LVGSRDAPITAMPDGAKNGLREEDECMNASKETMEEKD
jgi:hypothetical protein